METKQYNRLEKDHYHLRRYFLREAKIIFWALVGLLGYSVINLFFMSVLAGIQNPFQIDLLVGAVFFTIAQIKAVEIFIKPIYWDN